jgi:hypothetical protein
MGSSNGHGWVTEQGLNSKLGGWMGFQIFQITYPTDWVGLELSIGRSNPTGYPQQPNPSDTSGLLDENFYLFFFS